MSQAASSPSLLSASCLQTSHHRTDLQALTPNRRQREMHHETPVVSFLKLWTPSWFTAPLGQRMSLVTATGVLQMNFSLFPPQKIIGCVCVNAKEGEPSPALWGSCQPDTNRPPVVQLRGASAQSTCALRGVSSHSAELHSSGSPCRGNAGHSQSRGPRNADTRVLRGCTGAQPGQPGQRLNHRPASASSAPSNNRNGQASETPHILRRQSQSQEGGRTHRHHQGPGLGRERG